MEAAGAPRLDVERDSSWSAAQRGALVSVGCRGGTNRGVPDPKVLPSKVMPLRRPRNEAREYSYSWDSSQLRARDAGVLSSSSDPS